MLTSILSRRQVIQFCRRQLHHHAVSTQTIKPSLPTQPHLKRYNLSLIDQICPWIYIPLILHYPNNITIQDSILEKSIRLKNSMSDTLTQYYPFAGRLHSSGSWVHCDDKGIEFQEVTFECQLSEILKMSEHEIRDLLYPKHDFTCKYDSSLFVIRLNHFQCGGLSVLVCMSHKLGDATSFMTFMKSWAINTRRISNNSTSNQELIMESPRFISHPNGIIPTSDTIIPTSVTPWTTRNFVFPNSELAKLKVKIDGSYISTATRVELLASLLFQRVIATSSSSGDFTPKALVFPVNMRSKVIPPLPETSIGNFVGSMTGIIRNSNENNLNIIVAKIKAAKVELGARTKWEDLVNWWELNKLEFSKYKYFVCSSICRIQFYEIDFGWGNPIRVTLADTVLNNGFILMDTPNGDGIEAIVALDEDHMSLFQDDQEFLAYTDINKL